MRIVFAGTPEVAVPTLRALVASHHEVILVLTREDAPIGRKRVLTPSPVAAVAEALGLPLLKANSLTAEHASRIASLEPDVGVVVAFGALLTEPLLSTPHHGWLNIHFSALPRWRGATPVQHALLAGDDEIGITIFRLDQGLDTGDIVSQCSYPLQPGFTAGDVLTSLASRAPEQLIESLASIELGTAEFSTQTGDASYAPKLAREEGALDVCRSAPEILARWAATTPEPGAYIRLRDQDLKIIRLAPCPSGDDAPRLKPGAAELIAGAVYLGTASEPLLLLEVQPPGKNRMSAGDWIRGRGGRVTFR